jgi:hypothetical protein
MNRKSSVAAIDMPVRDQPVSVAIGCMKTASENIEPMPMQVINMPAPTTTQPYDSFISHPMPCAFPARIVQCPRDMRSHAGASTACLALSQHLT